jgi:serine/threonine protein kinase
MGVVYRAEHVTIRRPVAVKVLMANLAGVPELRGRFEREAIAIGRIDHPNCVSVFDFGAIADGSLYLAMEYLEGDALGDVLNREGQLDAKRALRILRHVLRGLEHIHAAGIIHRDIKLDNIYLVREDDDPEFAKILDFGIAKLIGSDVDDGVKLTQAGIAFGTPIYMSPEQALGNPLDGRSDLYAASVMAYEMLTGRPPFYSDDKIELLSMHTTREVPPMRERLSPGTPPVPMMVEGLIRHGLAKRPVNRIQSATEYIAMIEDILAQQTAALAAGVSMTGANPLVTRTGSSMIIGENFPPPGQQPALQVPSLPDLSEQHTRVHGRQPRRLPTWAYFAGMGLAGLIGVIIAIATRDDPQPKKKVETPAELAAAELDRGQPRAAIKILEQMSEQIQTDPAAQLVYGHALAAVSQNDKALDAYGRALTLEPSLESDVRLRSSVNAIVGNEPSAKIAADALELLATKTKLDVKQRVIEMTLHPDLGHRIEIRRVVSKLGMDSKIDWVAVYSLDLEDGATCKDRLKVVGQLRALGDATPKAITALEKAIARKGRGAKSNKCLVDEAKAAVAFLRGLSTKPP